MAAYTPTIGSEVHTADGDKLGEVKEIRGSHFKVNASMQPDYWLDTTCIAGVDGGMSGSRSRRTVSTSTSERIS